MASPFANVGLRMLGSESRFMSQGNKSPLSFYLGSLLMPKKEKPVELPPFSVGPLTSEKTSSAVEPPNSASAPVVPDAVDQSAQVNPVNQPAQANESESDNHPETQRVLDDLNLNPVKPQTNVSSTPLASVTPDLLKARNPAQDQLAGEMAIAPPPQMNFPQYGNQGGGGANALSVLSSLATLFG